MHHLAIAALGHMAQRQVAHRLERLVGDPDGFGVDVGGIDQVAMRQHRALGRAGRARGIDEDADVVGRSLRDQPVERGIGVGVFERIGLAELAKRVERHQLRLPVVPQALHVDANDGLQRRQAVIVGHASSTLSVCSWSPVMTTREPEWRTMYCSSTQGLVG